MNAQITIGAAVELAALILGALYSRWWVSPLLEVAPYSDGDITVTDTLLAGLAEGWPEPAMGAVVAQDWRWCADCMRMEPALLHADDCWRCGHCLTVTYAGAEAAS